MFADSQMQNGTADAAGKRWRPPPKQGRDKVTRRAAILLAAVALLFVGMKVCSNRQHSVAFATSFPNTLWGQTQHNKPSN